MKGFLIICILIISCSREKSAYKGQSEKYDDTNQIVMAIINHDSLNIFRKSNNSVQFCEELRKVTLEIPIKQQDGSIYPAAPGRIYITNLLHDKVGKKVVFSSLDSLALLRQNLNETKIRIAPEIIAQINTTTVEKQRARSKQNKSYKYFEMSIPLFSKDRMKAYIELGYHCGGLCGNGKSFYLQKINGNWTVMKEWDTWIS